MCGRAAPTLTAGSPGWLLWTDLSYTTQYGLEFPHLDEGRLWEGWADSCPSMGCPALPHSSRSQVQAQAWPRPVGKNGQKPCRKLRVHGLETVRLVPYQMGAAGGGVLISNPHKVPELS